MCIRDSVLPVLPQRPSPSPGHPSTGTPYSDRRRRPMRTQLTGAFLALLTAAPGVVMAQSKTDSSSSSRAERYRVRERQAPRMTQLTMVMGHPRLGLTRSSDSSQGGAVVADGRGDRPAG